MLTRPAKGERLLGASVRVHAIEYGWLERMQTVSLYAYRFDASEFVAYGGPEPHTWVASVPVRPLGPPGNVGSLLAAHAAAGIELRLLADLSSYWKQVSASTVGYSGMRLRNARGFAP